MLFRFFFLTKNILKIRQRKPPCNVTGELCRLVVLNTASLQLPPTTVAGVRAACGCRTPFDILPAVWLSSAISVTAGLLAARLLQRVWRD